MGRIANALIVVSLLVTVAALVTWRVTGGDYFTKFEVVEEIERLVAPDDPLAGTGFYDNDTQRTTDVRKEFHLGLFPLASGLFDKHWLSVSSVVTPFWVITLGVWWRARRSR
jgi:hypothetical protein